MCLRSSDYRRLKGRRLLRPRERIRLAIVAHRGVRVMIGPRAGGARSLPEWHVARFYRRAGTAFSSEVQAPVSVGFISHDAIDFGLYVMNSGTTTTPGCKVQS